MTMTMISPTTAAAFLHIQRVKDASEDAAAEFDESAPTTVGPAVDSDGLEDGLRGALHELKPHERLHVLTMSGDQRRRAIELLVEEGVLSAHDQERATCWLRATSRPSPRHTADTARAKAIRTACALQGGEP
jgi:hypothetical protein